ncbi:MAG: chorismate-binding protein, partial [Spirochaetales bacterium]|nr:chorismate-binding protein [Spirochaetales bacterium]
MEYRIKEIRGEGFTPFALAKKLNAPVILESTSLDQGKARYSLLLVEEAFRVIQEGDGDFLIQSGRSWERRKEPGKDILHLLEEYSAPFKYVETDFPFPAGGIGYLSYEFSRFCDKIRFPEAAAEGGPAGVFLFGHILLIYDHFTDMIHLVGMNYENKSIDLDEALARVEKRIFDLDFNYLNGNSESYTAKIVSPPEERVAYLTNVEKVKEEIVKGNLLQGVLSRRLEIETDQPALEAYRDLRSANPSPYLFYLDFGDYQLFGSSPEVHVKSDGRDVTIKPIAGTRRRGKNRAEEEALIQEMLNDPKERAEHLMLVDLARNDIGRFCEHGTVKPVSLFDVERFSAVVHMVSTVTGRRKPGTTSGDIIRATFPAGTVSGAPKIRAIETIAALENRARGFYAGLVGYFEPDGSFDTCITIRSAMKKGDKLTLQAGAGIVFDSTPEREWEETGEKLMALARAAG